jgi:hypothetical protein
MVAVETGENMPVLLFSIKPRAELKVMLKNQQLKA